MRFTAFEFFMALALVALTTWFVVPRVMDGSPQLQASRAQALSLKLEALYAQWQQVGGISGNPDENPALLTQRLLECFTAPRGVPYVSPTQPVYSRVFERPGLQPSPADVRLEGFTGVPVRLTQLPNDPQQQAVLLDGTYAILFDGQRWQVWPSL